MVCKSRGRGSRAVMRWARDATLLQDASFYSPVELSGPSVSLQQEKGLCVGSVCFLKY